MKNFAHRFFPSQTNRTLLLLHGTGGDENDLLPLGRAIDPQAALLSLRGQVMENGAARFFRRFAEGVFDEADVVARANELADFVAAAAKKYERNEEEMVAIGYSNGANIAAAMLLLGLAKFREAILFRAMPPLTSPPTVAQSERRALLIGGRFDPIATPAHVTKLAELFRDRRIQVDMRFEDSGHELTNNDVMIARDWLASAAFA